MARWLQVASMGPLLQLVSWLFTGLLVCSDAGLAYGRHICGEYFFSRELLCDFNIALFLELQSRVSLCKASRSPISQHFCMSVSFL